MPFVVERALHYRHGLRPHPGRSEGGPVAVQPLAMSDRLALGAAAAAREAGLAVPDDLSVTGFDDVAGSTLTEFGAALAALRFNPLERPVCPGSAPSRAHPAFFRAAARYPTTWPV